MGEHGVDEAQALGRGMFLRPAAEDECAARAVIRQNCAPLMPPALPSGSICVGLAIGRIALQDLRECHARCREACATLREARLAPLKSVGSIVAGDFTDR